VSGLEGFFINASFSTANFLGAGETLSLGVQTGARTKNYSISVTEPYLFDRPITAGIELFKRKLTYQSFVNVAGYTQENSGGSLTGGIPVGRWARLFLSYSYQIINIAGFQPATGTTSLISTGPVFDPTFFGGTGERRESTVSPSLVFSTVDNPYTPRSGSKLTGTLQLTGGVLGGTVSFYRPSLELIKYFPHTRKTALGVRAEGAFVIPFGSTTILPLYQRYFLGGENQIRGYNIRTVGPVDSSGRALGGTKYILFNAEYYVDIVGPLRGVLFYDAGQTYLEGDPISLGQLRTSTGVELRFIMPVLNVPFRLIYAFNPNRDSFQPKSTFKFSVGTTF
jgi:outer membrane protein insertion porin family